MNKNYNHITVCIYYILICLGLTACGISEDVFQSFFGNHVTGNQTLEVAKESSQPSEYLVHSESGEVPFSDGTDDSFYAGYLKKIWVIDNWDYGVYMDAFSISLTEIKDGVVEGALAINSIIRPMCYEEFQDSYSLWDGGAAKLSGTIHNGIACCKFSDKHGNRGNVTLVFTNEGKIEATMEYTEKEDIYKKVSINGKYYLRPYNLSDLDISQLTMQSFEVNLNSWENVHFVTAIIGDITHKPYPEAYLANVHNDILYEFSPPFFHVGSGIIDVLIEDMNEDGLKDVKITTSFYDYEIGPIDPDLLLIEWTFQQLTNGWFVWLSGEGREEENKKDEEDDMEENEEDDEEDDIEKDNHVIELG